MFEEIKECYFFMEIYDFKGVFYDLIDGDIDLV